MKRLEEFPEQSKCYIWLGGEQRDTQREREKAQEHSCSKESQEKSDEGTRRGRETGSVREREKRQKRRRAAGEGEERGGSEEEQDLGGLTLNSGFSHKAHITSQPDQHRLETFHRSTL